MTTDNVNDINAEDLIDSILDEVGALEEATDALKEVANEESGVDTNLNGFLGSLKAKKDVRGGATVDPSIENERNLTKDRKTVYEADYPDNEEVGGERISKDD